MSLKRQSIRYVFIGNSTDTATLTILVDSWVTVTQSGEARSVRCDATTEERGARLRSVAARSVRVAHASDSTGGPGADADTTATHRVP
ncbi:unnamed protein product, partial [Brenthis ino]